jgi:enamine deaminase RidA (YjgF/YER057c/UK114 family)
MDVYEKLKELGLELPTPPPAGGVYSPVKEFGKSLLYTSGVGPTADGKPLFTGKAGRELSLEDAQKAAVASTLNILSVLHRDIGDLNRVKNIVKMLAFVASSEDFYDQPKVMNPSTELLIKLFGDPAGRPARSAIGTNVLPGNIPVEIELLIEIKD